MSEKDFFLRVAWSFLVFLLAIATGITIGKHYDREQYVRCLMYRTPEQCVELKP
jgi:hypothetical protein